MWGRHGYQPVFLLRVRPRASTGVCGPGGGCLDALVQPGRVARKTWSVEVGCVVLGAGRHRVGRTKVVGLVHYPIDGVFTTCGWPMRSRRHGGNELLYTRDVGRVTCLDCIEVLALEIEGILDAPSEPEPF